MRLRPQRKPDPVEIEGAICHETFRTSAIGMLIERGQVFPLDHAYVRAYPAYFRGLVRLDEEVENDA
jgi:hypothetical protein